MTVMKSFLGVAVVSGVLILTACSAITQYLDDKDWQVACAGNALEVEMESGPHYAVYPDGMPDRDNLRRISENVFAFTG